MCGCVKTTVYLCIYGIEGTSLIPDCVQIKDEKKPPPTPQPPPPLSVLPGGFLKQLVRETEKETKEKEPELKEEKVVRSSVSYFYGICTCM